MISRGIWLIALAGISVVAKSRESDARFFDDRVAPILIKNCLGCHNHELDDGNISFENRATLLKERNKGGGAGGVAAVIPGQPEESPLIRALLHNGDVRMPPGQKLSSRDIGILTDWIKRGAPWGTKLRPVGTAPGTPAVAPPE